MIENKILEVLEDKDFRYAKFDSDMISKLKDNVYLKNEFKSQNNIATPLIEKIKKLNVGYHACSCEESGFENALDECIDIVKEFFNI